MGLLNVGCHQVQSAEGVVQGMRGKTGNVPGSALIGRGVPAGLSESGFRDAVSSRDHSSPKRTVNADVSAGGNMGVKCADIGGHNPVGKAVRCSERESGGAAICIDDAGWDCFADLDTNSDLWDEIALVHYFGALRLHHIVLRGLDQRLQGRVTNIDSEASAGSSIRSVYAGWSHLPVTFYRTVEREILFSAVTVKAVRPRSVIKGDELSQGVG
jgi:NADP-dependent 3-hydroxy acid dehydrogenase YdfG